VLEASWPAKIILGGEITGGKDESKGGEIEGDEVIVSGGEVINGAEI